MGAVSTIEEAQAKVNEKLKTCWGNHVQVTDIEGFEVLSIEEGAAPSDEEKIAEVQAMGYKTWTDTATLKADGVEITSFAYGMPMANIAGANYNLDFMSLPSGKRVYYGPAAPFAQEPEAKAEA